MCFCLGIQKFKKNLSLEQLLIKKKQKEIKKMMKFTRFNFTERARVVQDDNDYYDEQGVMLCLLERDNSDILFMCNATVNKLCVM